MTIFATIGSFGLYVMLGFLFISLILHKKNISKLFCSLASFSVTFSLIMLSIYIFTLNIIIGAILTLFFSAITIWAGIKLIRIYKSNNITE